MREAKVYRKTKETDIELKLNLDGGAVSISTGVGFFDHMLKAFAAHGGFGLDIRAEGDLQVDCHHTVEDVGIVLGKAFAQAIGDKVGIERFGCAKVPMDEALVEASLDISARPFLIYNAHMPQEKIGDYDSCMTVEFMRAFAFNAGLTLHINEQYGDNAHHITEAMFKAVARALKVAVKVTGRELPSTKGAL